MPFRPVCKRMFITLDLSLNALCVEQGRLVCRFNDSYDKIHRLKINVTKAGREFVKLYDRRYYIDQFI